ncbi:MAG: amidohydrolase family protein [Pirellulaceae bacterium]|nr:amidohydrolase family protein [Pirellulaceae bacterium]MDP7017446.1 amidohydrolase family protein [Pirellulaceae bacterium]
MIIDAHQHFWHLLQPFNYKWLNTPENEPIRRSYVPADLADHLQSAGVDRSIVVQTQHTVEENRWALELAEEHEFIAGVVGWVDLASHDCEYELLEFKDHPKFVGVRHVTQDEPDDNFIIRPQVMRGLRVLQRHRIPFDLLFYVKHLHHAAALAVELPDLPMVIDHLAKPRIKDQALHDWEESFRTAAAFPNIYCKLSGMVTEADWNEWTPADLKPYVEIALEAFGPDRCMYGSDWPVCELAATYEQVHAALNEVLGPLSETENAAIFGGTASRFYNLTP